MSGQINKRDKYSIKDSGKRESFNTGAVRDMRQGKGRYDLISPLALRRLACVYERGSLKYEDRNWESGMPISRTLDSAVRHIYQYLEGHRDEDHLAHAAWNLFAAMHFEEGAERGILPEEIVDTVDYTRPDPDYGDGDGDVVEDNHCSGTLEADDEKSDSAVRGAPGRSN